MKQVITFFALFTLSFTVQAQEALEKTGKATTEIQFVEDMFNFGEIVQGEKVQNVFEFENTGTEPLIITHAKGSCGCTVPEWPREPIMPGEKASLLVEFNSANKKGPHSKRVTITANTDPVNTFLTLRGKILLKEEAEELVEKREKDVKINENSIQLFPNPSASVLNVDVSQYQGKSAEVMVFDINGQLYQSRTIDKITDNLQLDVTELAAATYTLSIKIEGMQRLAKQFSVVRN